MCWQKTSTFFVHQISIADRGISDCKYAKPFSAPFCFLCVVRENFRKIAAEAEETNIINQHLAIPTRERERALQNSCKEKDKEPCWLHLISARRLKKVCKSSLLFKNGRILLE